MHSVAVRPPAPTADPEAPRGYVTAAGACVGALGMIDLLIGIAMFIGASTYDATLEGAPTALAMRSYGLRSVLAGGVCFAFVWAVFAEPGARAVWFVFPVAIVLAQLAFDLSGLSEGALPAKMLALTAAVHEVLASAVGAVAVAGWRKERALRAKAKPS
jgi:hypothetical protein